VKGFWKQDDELGRTKRSLARREEKLLNLGPFSEPFFLDEKDASEDEGEEEDIAEVR
jgi:hypothetical protein